MSSLESNIDRLYQEPLDQFVSARNALAKTLSGSDARRVKQLVKPTVVPWAVNQVYWHSRPIYDRLVQSGAALRAAQIATLGGKSGDVPKTVQAHRAAIARAVEEARRLAASHGVHPDTDTLSRTFDALSLSANGTEPAGRLTKPLQLAGFEALAGITVKAPARDHAEPHPDDKRPAAEEPASRRRKDDEAARHEAAAAARERKAEAAERRKKAAALGKAQAAVKHARTAEERARTQWERRKWELKKAEQALEQLDE